MPNSKGKALIILVFELKIGKNFHEIESGSKTMGNGAHAAGNSQRKHSLH